MRNLQPQGFGLSYTTTSASSANSGNSDADNNADLHLMLLDWLRKAENSTPETEFRRISAEDLEFYAGRQDSAEVLQELENQKRPSETYNEIKPKIDMLVGLAAQVRNDMQLVPVGEEDEPLTELMTGVLKHFQKKLNTRDKEMEAFGYVAKAGRGLVELYVNTDNPFKPEIKFKFHKGHTFYIDPNFQEYDLSDARYVFVDHWITEDEAKRIYKDFDSDSVRIAGMERNSDYPIFWDEANELYRLVVGWYRKTEDVYWFVSPFTGKPDYVKVADWAKFTKSLDDINAEIKNGKDVLKNGGKEVQTPQPVKGIKPFTYFAIFDGSKILSQGVNTYWHEDFPYVFIGAYKDDNNNNWFSAITMMKDPQVGLNTMRRQLVHLLQTSPKGILQHESGAVLDIEEYERRGSDPTYHMELAAGGLEKVRFSQQPQINPIYQTFGEVCVQSMKDSSGIQDSLMGIQTTSREPGVTVRMRQETGFAVLYVLFKNFSKSSELITKKLFSLIQQYVDEPTIIRIEGPNGANLLKINTQINPQVTGFNDITVGEFDMVIEEGVESTTMRMAIAQWLIEYSQNNPGVIPPDIILEYSNVPFSVKQRVREYTAQQAAAAQAAQQQEFDLKSRELDIKEKAATAKANGGGENK